MSPGPGLYTFKEYMGSAGIKSSMHQKFLLRPEDKENASKPGPGNYDVESL